MHILIAPAAILALAAPAAVAAQPAAPPVEEAIPDAAELDRMEEIARRLFDIVLDLEMGPLLDAVDPEGGEGHDEAEGDMTVRDIARRDDPDFEAKADAALDALGDNMGRMTRLLAALAPAMRDLADELGAQIEQATRDASD
ncbi:MAG: hypothetical protein ACFBQW_04035 [Sphingomonadaceae bacterium]